MVKKLLRSIREYKKQTLLTPVFVTLEVLCDVVIPLLMAKLIDNGIDAGNLQVIVKLGVILIALAAVSLVFGVLAGSSAAVAMAGFAKNLRHDIFYKVQEFSFANIDKYSTGGIVTRLTTDITNVQMAFMMVIRMAVRSPGMLIFSLIMAFYINSRAAMVYLIVIPVLVVGLFFIIKNAHPLFVRVFQTYDKLNNVVQENLRGIRVVKTFVRGDYEIAKFSRISGEIYRDFSRAERIIAFNMPLMQTAVYAAMLLISWISARLIVAGSMTTGELMSFFSYTMMTLMSLMMLSMVFVMLTISRASMQRIGEILAEESTITNPPEPLTAVADGSIVFDNVAFSYAADAELPCLSGVNLTIRSGQTIGILGGTGASKTTLVQLIPRLYDVNSGSVLVGGHDVREYDLQALRESVAMVLQKNVLFSGTIKENLRWGDPYATDEEMERACRIAAAHDFISAFPEGYDTHLEQGGSNVSGGQRQRLCIARALLKKPRILILDDSTSAVDTATDARIRRALREELPEVTKLIIAQRVSSVEDADQIIIMDQGTIIAAGTHEELLRSNHIYREVYESQNKGGEADGE